VTRPPATAAWIALAGWGLGMAAAPRRIAGLTGGADPPPAVVRVLGVRRLLQEVVLLVRPSPAVVLGAAAVDVLHATSMLAAVRLWPRYRRAELTSAAVSVASATVTVLAGRPRRRP
jgi:hypothetical protein